MKKTLVALCGGAVLLAAASSSPSSFSARNGAADFQLEPRIAFGSTRDHAFVPVLRGSEVYLTDYVTDSDGRLESLTDPLRLTDNEAYDGFPSLSPDGKKIVFDSTRLTGCPECPYPGTIDRSDLFVMNTDGTDQTFLIRGSSASWSPDSRQIAFHASASGTGEPRNPGLVGSSTTDSDIFVANVDDLLADAEYRPTNITNNGDTKIEDDVDWSPDGEKIVYVRHPERELYLLNADGSGTPQQLTNNLEEERGPTWSPDGARIAFGCRTGGGLAEICVLNADGTGVVQQLTNNTVPDLTPTWSLDGRQILFHRRVGAAPPFTQQLFVIDVPTDTAACEYDVEPCDLPWTQLTAPPGFNHIAHWGQRRVPIEPGSGALPASIAVGPPSDPGSEAGEALNGVLTFRRATLGAPASQSEIWMMNADGSHGRRVTCNSLGEVASAWAPDGQTIAFYSDERTPEGLPIQNIYLVDVQDGCSPGALLTEGRFPSWSPDGRLVFDRGRLGVRDIFVRERDGTEVNLTNDAAARNTRADWSPDGRKIAFARGVGEDAEDIHVMNADGFEMIQLTFDPAGDNGPEWSPDGRKIVFQSDRDSSPGEMSGDDEIYVMNPDGTEQTRLTYHPGQDAFPRWSPDGRHIVFHRDTDPSPTARVLQLFIMNADGTGLRHVTELPTTNAFPDWGHGRVVAVQISPDHGAKVWWDARFSGGAYDDVAVVTSSDGGHTWLPAVPRDIAGVAGPNREAFTPQAHASADGRLADGYDDFRHNDGADGDTETGAETDHRG
jgi:TolB protein